MSPIMVHMSERLDKIRSKFSKAKHRVELEDDGMSTERNATIGQLAMGRGVKFQPLTPGELEYYAQTVVEKKTCEGARSAQTYLGTLGISVQDKQRINAAADAQLIQLAEERQESAKALSLARHDHIYQEAIRGEDTLGHALKAQAGIDRITGTNTTSDESESITRGLLQAMKEVYNDAEKSD